jgi:hypothetical protein
MPMSRPETAAFTMPFEKFWSWLSHHSNCIVRAGTPEVLLFDHEEYHWHLAAEEDGLLLVQLVRGKELIAEMVVLITEISYVQVEPGEGEECSFECVVESEAAREVAYHFVLAHGYDENETPSARRWTH